MRFFLSWGSLGSRAVSSSVPVPDPESRRTMATSMHTIRSNKLHRRLINVEFLMVKTLHGFSFRAEARARARSREEGFLAVYHACEGVMAQLGNPKTDEA